MELTPLILPHHCLYYHCIILRKAGVLRDKKQKKYFMCRLILLYNKWYYRLNKWLHLILMLMCVIHSFLRCDHSVPVQKFLFLRERQHQAFLWGSWVRFTLLIFLWGILGMCWCLGVLREHGSDHVSAQNRVSAFKMIYSMSKTQRTLLLH